MTSTTDNQQSVYQFRINTQDKQEAFAVFDELGLKPSQAIRLFLKQVKETRSIPFAVKIPNDQTCQAMNDVKQGKHLVKCSDADDLFAKLGI